MQSNQINLDFIKKAQANFEEYRQNLDTEQEKTGAIHAFEYCYELSWKLMKRTLQSRGLECGSPKDTFRKSLAEGLITDINLWFEFLEIRNMTSHDYNLLIQDECIAIFEKFSIELERLIQKIQTLI